jgi:hypothetical protein
MAIYNVTNQLLQIDTGKALTQYWNPNQSPISVYAQIGEIQVPGQRYFAVGSQTAANPFGSQLVLELVYYSSIAQPAPTSAPAPVYWTDNTYTTVTGVQSESLIGLNGIAGYMMVNTTSVTGLTAANIQGAQLLIAIAGRLVGAVAPASTVAGDWIVGAAGNWIPARVAQGTAPGYRTFGVAETAVSGGLANILLNCDII